MEIIKNGIQESVKGPEEWFTGDVVWFETEEKQWHGASPNQAMSHIVIQEEKDGKVVDWMKKVPDEQYSKMMIK